jgi:hypothetical protein
MLPMVGASCYLRQRRIARASWVTWTALANLPLGDVANVTEPVIRGTRKRSADLEEIGQHAAEILQVPPGRALLRKRTGTWLMCR